MRRLSRTHNRESRQVCLDFLKNRAMIGIGFVWKMTHKAAKRDVSLKLFRFNGRMFTVKCSSPQFLLGGIISSFYLFAPSSVWANTFLNSFNLDSPSKGRHLVLAYGTTEDRAVLHRVSRLHSNDGQRRTEYVIASKVGTIILCPKELQIPKKLFRFTSYCETQRSPLNLIPGYQDPSLPYLLTPRLGQVREVKDMTPKVRWNPVNGALGYTVRLFQKRDNKEIFKKTYKPDSKVFKSSTLLLSRELKLLPGELYQLLVEADIGDYRSSIEPCMRDLLHIGVLLDAESRELDQRLAEISSRRGSGVAPEMLELEVVDELLKRNLKAEAFDSLQQSEKRKQSLQGQFLLGVLSSSQGLNQQAQVYFSQAATLASKVGDAEALREATNAGDMARNSADQAKNHKCDMSVLTPIRSVQ